MTPITDSYLTFAERNFQEFFDRENPTLNQLYNLRERANVDEANAATREHIAISKLTEIVRKAFADFKKEIKWSN
ncbi:MAG: hypothetical protein IJU03_08330 [Thermoguttaceae bacterium]|nr:hypothetical protein [Thermoguttaceae bacterium]